MQDAADLALALAQGNDWRAAVRDYELRMFARAEPAAAGAWEAIEQVFSADGLARMLQMMEGQRQAATEGGS
jgi:hypothetical protein